MPCLARRLPGCIADESIMRASKDGDGEAEHVLSTFCGGLQTMLIVALSSLCPLEMRQSRAMDQFELFTRPRFALGAPANPVV